MWRGQVLPLVDRALACWESSETWLMSTVGPGHGAVCLLCERKAEEGKRPHVFLLSLSGAPQHCMQETGTEVV